MKVPERGSSEFGNVYKPRDCTLLEKSKGKNLSGEAFHGTVRIEGLAVK